jgi:hypothetical protein
MCAANVCAQALARLGTHVLKRNRGGACVRHKEMAIPGELHGGDWSEEGKSKSNCKRGWKLLALVGYTAGIRASGNWTIRRKS